MFLGQRLAELLEGPFCTRRGRRIVMQDLAPAQFHDHEYIKDTESGCKHHEKVTSHDGLGMIVHEGQPPLTRIRRPTAITGRYLCTVRGETRIPSFNFSSLAMCSLPQVGFSAAIFRITLGGFLGRAGLPTRLDSQRQNKRSPRRSHRISVSGFTTTSAPRHSNSRLRQAISHLAQSWARWGLTLRA